MRNKFVYLALIISGYAYAQNSTDPCQSFSSVNCQLACLKDALKECTSDGRAIINPRMFNFPQMIDAAFLSENEKSISPGDEKTIALRDFGKKSDPKFLQITDPVYFGDFQGDVSGINLKHITVTSSPNSKYIKTSEILVHKHEYGGYTAKIQIPSSCSIESIDPINSTFHFSSSCELSVVYEGLSNIYSFGLSDEFRSKLDWNGYELRKKPAVFNVFQLSDNRSIPQDIPVAELGDFVKFSNGDLVKIDTLSEKTGISVVRPAYSIAFPMLGNSNALGVYSISHPKTSDDAGGRGYKVTELVQLSNEHNPFSCGLISGLISGDVSIEHTKKEENLSMYGHEWRGVWSKVTSFTVTNITAKDDEGTLILDAKGRYPTKHIQSSMESKWPKLTEGFSGLNINNGDVKLNIGSSGWQRVKVGKSNTSYIEGGSKCLSWGSPLSITQLEKDIYFQDPMIVEDCTIRSRPNHRNSYRSHICKTKKLTKIKKETINDSQRLYVYINSYNGKMSLKLIGHE